MKKSGPHISSRLFNSQKDKRVLILLCRSFFFKTLEATAAPPPLVSSVQLTLYYLSLSTLHFPHFTSRSTQLLPPLHTSTSMAFGLQLTAIIQNFHRKIRYKC
jgi:hypothetical protein